MNAATSQSVTCLPQGRDKRPLTTILTVILAAFGAFFFMLTAPGTARAEAVRHHASSLIKTPKYPPDFTHFDYVNPKAPKGGTVRLPAIGTYDNLNPMVFKGNLALGLGLVFESLMADSLEEPSTSYGLIAEWISYPEDFSSVTFGLRAGARWHDGKPITVDDVIFSFQTLKSQHPFYAHYLKNVTKVEKTGPRQVTFRFDVTNNRELPHIVGQLTIFPKHYWQGKNADGQQRDPGKSTLEPPLGSGPYRIKEVKPGRSIIYERVADYWGKDLPVNVGQNNFDIVRYEYFRDQTVAFEAFKGGQLDFYRESSSKNWATGYDFKAVKQGWVKKQLVPLATSQPMQAFVFNIRRTKFADRRVRQAFNLAFDFEWANKNLFYGQYKRVDSYFANTELAARGLPQGREKEILLELKDKIPPEVFTKEYKNPVNRNQRDLRRHLREAMRLLKAAGWEVRNQVLTNTRTGEKMEVEFLLVSPLFERIVLPYIRNLARLGIKGKIRLVDAAQYARRVDNFDYDIVIASFSQSHSPGNEQRNFWGSAAADRPGSRNLIGIKDPAIDALIDKIIFAKDRAELVAATRALDRVLLWNHFVVPQWYAPYERIAYWDIFGQPKTLPALSVGFPTVWWYDAEKAGKLAGARK